MIKYPQILIFILIIIFIIFIIYNCSDNIINGGNLLEFNIKNYFKFDFDNNIELIIFKVKNIKHCLNKFINYINVVGLPTITINEFRNNHYGRGGSTHHLHHLQLMGVK